MVVALCRRGRSAADVGLKAIAGDVVDAIEARRELGAGTARQSRLQSNQACLLFKTITTGSLITNAIEMIDFLGQVFRAHCSPRLIQRAPAFPLSSVVERVPSLG